MRLLAILALCALPPLAQQDTDDEVPSWNFGINERNAKAFEAMQGMWRLTSIDRPPLNFDKGALAGNLLVGQGFLALEFHSILLGEDRYEGPVFQSGMHRFDFTQRGTLRTYSMIGTNNIDAEGEVSFEYPGGSREFVVIHSEELLSLERTDNKSRLNFRRIRWQPRKQRDFFGREIDTDDPTKGDDRDGR